MKNIRFIVYPAILLFVFMLGLDAFAQAGKATFQIFENDKDVIATSKVRKASPSVFGDKDGDGIYDSVVIQDMELTTDIDVANAFGVTYLDGKKVVYYPSTDASIPLPGEYKLYGFLHYFDEAGRSIFFAIVVNRIGNLEEEALKKANKKLVPYQVDFIDSNGLRVGIPSLLMLPQSKLIYNADFQKFYKSPETIVLGTNPNVSSVNRELFIFRKIPESSENLLLIHYKWY